MLGNDGLLTCLTMRNVQVQKYSPEEVSVPLLTRCNALLGLI